MELNQVSSQLYMLHVVSLLSPPSIQYGHVLESEYVRSS